MASRFVFTPQSAAFPSANFPQLTTVNARPVLAFDTATAETCHWAAIAPQGLTAPFTAVVTYMAAVASGGVAFGVAVEAVSDGDATDLDAGDSFDTQNVGTATVPATAGHIDQISITLTTNDSMAAGDYLRLQVQRVVGNAADTAAGDVYCLAVELRDSA